jgi:hypothetical protein
MAPHEGVDPALVPRRYNADSEALKAGQMNGIIVAREYFPWVGSIVVAKREGAPALKSKTWLCGEQGDQ